MHPGEDEGASVKRLVDYKRCQRKERRSIFQGAVERGHAGLVGSLWRCSPRDGI